MRVVSPKSLNEGLLQNILNNNAKYNNEVKHSLMSGIKDALRDSIIKS
jgi:hypothetical protein